jgi:hypothetical protein
MRGAPALLGVVLLVSLNAAAQHTAPRAWQQRLQVDVPLAVPMVELEAVNPFAAPVDEPPRLLSSAAPRKVDVSGAAVVAAYVDAKGDCLGSVPLDLPFPGLTSRIVEELAGSRFEPARVGSTATPSWVVLELAVEGRVKEGEAAPPQLELPDPTRPPRQDPPPRISPPGNLVRLPATPAPELTTLASPRRIKVSAPGGAAEAAVNALVHVTSAGRCDRFVILDLPAGLSRWLSAYLATWRLEPARRDGAPVETWIVYSGRVALELSGLQSISARTLSDRSYDPLSESDTVGD